MTSASLRVFLVERHELTRRGLIEILTDDGIKVVGETATCAVARAMAPRLPFDVALVDVQLKDGDGIDLAAQLREIRPSAAVVMLGSAATPVDVIRAVRNGAAGFLTKDMPTGRLGSTLRAAAAGEAALSREMTAMVVRELQRVNDGRGARAADIRARLTAREWQILRMLAEGRRTADVAADLVISVETVRSHVKAVMRKLGVHTRAAAVGCLEELRDAMEQRDSSESAPAGQLLSALHLSPA
ncbi:MAG: hypothetical protein AVDCRST_MAG79-1870 [uncultured Thermoleophilia bacterium]|uniref:Two-component transcriptional response regulator, LuxR family n=1 Tax=uncultured Thermoleophilia bacterium TaxID=1497501 RepID=A0A6J4U7J8_9ACTN|nr:MAG: hypothetical protein AVDCRST_MAG79-1870 [uncultured Thermoleophilia bacterium]